MRRIHLAFILISAAIAVSAPRAHAGRLITADDIAQPRTQQSIQAARYSTVDPTPLPEMANPLATVVTVTFPRGHVRSVGDAIHHLLGRTGYSLMTESLDASAQNLLSLPLPDSHRRLGPHRVDDVLGVLLGEPWAVSVDPIARTVKFQTKAAALPLAAPLKAPSATTSNPLRSNP